MENMDYESSTFRNGAIDKLNGKFGKDEPKPKKVQTTKAVTVSNKPKKKGPVGKMGEIETRVRATAIKLREGFGFTKDMRTPHEQRILNKDARIYNKKAQSEKLEKMKEMGRQFETRKKVAKLQKKGYNKSGF
jgi:hypothetical protein